MNKESQLITPLNDNENEETKLGKFQRFDNWFWYNDHNNMFKYANQPGLLKIKGKCRLIIRLLELALLLFNWIVLFCAS